MTTNVKKTNATRKYGTRRYAASLENQFCNMRLHETGWECDNRDPEKPHEAARRAWVRTPQGKIDKFNVQYNVHTNERIDERFRDIKKDGKASKHLYPGTVKALDYIIDNLQQVVFGNSDITRYIYGRCDWGTPYEYTDTYDGQRKLTGVRMRFLVMDNSNPCEHQHRAYAIDVCPFKKTIHVYTFMQENLPILLHRYEDSIILGRPDENGISTVTLAYYDVAKAEHRTVMSKKFNTTTKFYC